jgi:hypothetical protein
MMGGKMMGDRWMGDSALDDFAFRPISGEDGEWNTVGGA